MTGAVASQLRPFFRIHAKEPPMLTSEQLAAIVVS